MFSSAMRGILFGSSSGPTATPPANESSQNTTDRKIIVARPPPPVTENDRPPQPAHNLAAGTTITSSSSKTPTLVNSSMKNTKRKKRSSSELEEEPTPAPKRTKTATPVLSEHEQLSSEEAEDCPPLTPTEHRLAADDPQYRSDLLRRIPPEVVGLCLSYLCSTSERHSLQTTCRLFRRLSNAPDTMLSKLALGGDTETGRGGLITDSDDPDSAVAKLGVFARSGNIEAVYLLGIIRSYCYDGAHYGIGLLRYAADRGCARSSYTLGLILRDSYREESKRWLTKAANAGHMPAWQEILPAPEMKSRFGDLDADMLKSYLDPASLNRLLNRHYLKTKSVRTVHTSHCWNPLCGRWAYKATNQTTRDMRERESRNPVPSFLEFLPDLGCGSGCGTGGSGGDCGDGAIGSKNASGATSKPAASDSTVTSGAAAAAAAMVMGSSSRTGAQPGGIDRNSNNDQSPDWYLRVSRMKMCSSCRRAKYCSKLCQVYDWRSGRHKMECQFL